MTPFAADAVAAAGGIPLLVNLLRSPAVGVQEQSSLAIRPLTVDSTNRAAVIAAGAVPPLVVLLASPSPMVQQSALSTIQNLAADGARAAAAARAVLCGC